MSFLAENAEMIGIIASLIWNAFLQKSKAKK